MEKFNGIKKIRAKYSAQGIPHERRLLLFQKTVLKDSLNQNEKKTTTARKQHGNSDIRGRRKPQAGEPETAINLSNKRTASL